MMGDYDDEDPTTLPSHDAKKFSLVRTPSFLFPDNLRHRLIYQHHLILPHIQFFPSYRRDQS